MAAQGSTNVGSTNGGRNELAAWLGLGLALGASLGLALSVMVGQIVFLALGIGPGLLVGAIIGTARARRAADKGTGDPEVSE